MWLGDRVAISGGGAISSLHEVKVVLVEWQALHQVAN